MLDCLRRIKIHIEIPTLLLFMAYYLAVPITTNLIIFRTCYVTMGFNKTDCEMLGSNYTNDTTAELEKKVQSKATILLICLSTVEATIPPVLGLFLGPWTDVYGRKPVMLSSIGGCFFSFIVIIIVSALPNASPWYFLLFLVPMCLSGGISALLMSILCYATDVTSEEYRGVRMGGIDAIITAGTIIATSSSSFVFQYCGYVTVYSICAGSVLLAWLYTYFFIPESIEVLETENKFRNLFKLSWVKESLCATFRSKENYDRGLLLTTVILVATYIFLSYGDSTVIILYVRENFHWTLKRYTLYTSISNVSIVAGGIIGVFILHKIFHFKESIVILIGFISIIAGSLLQGLTNYGLLIYIASIIKALSGAIKPLSLSFLSKLISTVDSGKVFSVVTSLQMIGALVGTTAYTYIYKATLLSNPATFNFVTCGISAIEVILVISIILMQKYRTQPTYGIINS